MLLLLFLLLLAIVKQEEATSDSIKLKYSSNEATNDITIVTITNATSTTAGLVSIVEIMPLWLPLKTNADRNRKICFWNSPVHVEIGTRNK